MSNLHRIKPGSTVKLGKIPTDGKAFWKKDRETAEAEFMALREELIVWQTRWYAEGKRKLLIAFQAMDAGGKDGTIRRVFQGVNPQAVRVTSFKAPSKIELAHDFLWRIHKEVPAKGMIRIFNRSHYEDVLVVRVHNMIPKSVWHARYKQINRFEKLLTDTGTTILKFYLHISPEEQRERFQERIDDPAKHWKFSHDDLEKRKSWKKYMKAYESMLNKCGTTHAPWYVIPADRKWYRNLAITKVIVKTLRKLDPKYPTQTKDLSRITVV